jgi:hypothetical protein
MKNANINCSYWETAAVVSSMTDMKIDWYSDILDKLTNGAGGDRFSTDITILKPSNV